MPIYGGTGGGGAVPAPAPVGAPSYAGGGSVTGLGFVARITPIPGVTPPQVLNQAIRLPAILNSQKITDTALHNEYQTLSGGQFSQPAMGPPSYSPTQLRDIPIESLTMAWDPAWFVVTGQNEWDLRNALLMILYSHRPVHLLVTHNPWVGSWPNVDEHVTFRQLDREIKAGEDDTTYYTFQIKGWRDPAVAAASSNRR